MKSNIITHIEKILIGGVIFLISTFSSCDKDVSITSYDAPIPQASLYINSSPSGSTIFVDGKNTGRITPDSLPFIEGGTYQVTLKRKYFRDTSFTIEAVENEKRSININYLANPLMLGSLSIKSVPTNSLILVNDSSVNKVTPAVLEGLTPGEYRITFEKENYRSESYTAKVESNKTSEIFQFLQDTSVWVDYKKNKFRYPVGFFNCCCY